MKIMIRLVTGALFTSVLLANVFANAKPHCVPISSPLLKPDKSPPAEPLKRSISLDTGYLSSLNSNRAIGEFDLELRQAWGALYDWQNDVYRPSDSVERAISYSILVC
jgi:hypothetical protein